MKQHILMGPFLSHHVQITLSKCKIRLLRTSNAIRWNYSECILESALVSKKYVSKLPGVVPEKLEEYSKNSRCKPASLGEWVRLDKDIVFSVHRWGSRGRSKWILLHNIKYFKFVIESTGKRKEEATFLGIRVQHQGKTKNCNQGRLKRSLENKYLMRIFKIFASGIRDKSLHHLSLLWNTQNPFHWLICYASVGWREGFFWENQWLSSESWFGLEENRDTMPGCQILVMWGWLSPVLQNESWVYPDFSQPLPQTWVMLRERVKTASNMVFVSK